jgi:hypothetical protein
MVFQITLFKDVIAPLKGRFSPKSNRNALRSFNVSGRGDRESRNIPITTMLINTKSIVPVTVNMNPNIPRSF